MQQEEQQNRKKAIATSFKGVIYLVIVMLGIFGITSLVKMIGLSSGNFDAESKEEKAKWEESRQIREANGKLCLKKIADIDTGISSLPLRVYLHVLNYENGILQIQLDNQSGYTMEYREFWKIEYEKDGNWTELATLYNQTDEEKTELTYEDMKPVLLMDLTKVSMDCDLNKLGELKPGNYKILLDDLEAVFTLDEVENEK